VNEPTWLLAREIMHNKSIGGPGKVYEHDNDGEAVDVFFLAFAKAFDKVPYKRLIEQLRAQVEY
jgi:hypothetical protein